MNLDNNETSSNVGKIFDPNNDDEISIDENEKIIINGMNKDKLSLKDLHKLIIKGERISKILITNKTQVEMHEISQKLNLPIETLYDYNTELKGGNSVVIVDHDLVLTCNDFSIDS